MSDALCQWMNGMLCLRWWISVWLHFSSCIPYTVRLFLFFSIQIQILSKENYFILIYTYALYTLNVRSLNHSVCFNHPVSIWLQRIVSVTIIPSVIGVTVHHSLRWKFHLFTTSVTNYYLLIVRKTSFIVQLFVLPCSNKSFISYSIHISYIYFITLNTHQ